MSRKRRAAAAAVGLSALVLSLTAVASSSRGDAQEVAVQPFEVEIEGQSIHGRSAGPKAGAPVLLLHGMAFDSGTWEELGTLALLSKEGFRAVAVDLPGFGGSKAARLDPDRFLEKLIPALGLGRLVIVSPSMSGRFSFPYVIAHPEGVAGFVPVAPAGATEYTERLRGSPVPALVVWGERDAVFPIAQAQPLAEAFAEGRVLVLPGARHPAYLDQPALFHRELVAFAKSVSTREPSRAKPKLSAE